MVGVGGAWQEELGAEPRADESVSIFVAQHKNLKFILCCRDITRAPYYLFNQGTESKRGAS